MQDDLKLSCMQPTQWCNLSNAEQLSYTPFSKDHHTFFFNDYVTINLKI